MQQNSPRLFQLVREWAIERNLHNADPTKQLAKTIEELGETAAALLRGKDSELADGLGDVMVCLTILAQQKGLDIETCFADAYGVIAKRTGVTRNGVFVKSEDL